MKKFLLLPLLILFYNVSSAQVVFLETFDNIDGATAGGPGTYAFPTGWFLRNVDNLTPNAAVSYVTDSWTRREDFANNVADSCAFSTSWYTPAGTSDDWMWTPAIASLPANSELTWNAVTYDAAYPDGYEVRIMTAGPPTGGAGVIGNQITNSTVLFTTVAENTTWTAHTVSLSAYAGQTVYIGFRNNSTDKFILLIDDVKVEGLSAFDAGVATVPAWSEYTIIPESQQPSFTLAAEIENNGSSAVTGIVLNGEVLNSTLTSVFNSNSLPLASLAGGASSTLTAANVFTPTAQDTYSVFYSVSINEADANPLNDTLSGGTVVISDTIMARDNNTITGTLGIGAGVNGYLGNQYDISQPTQLSSISIFLNNQLATSSVGVAVFNMAAGVPTTLLYASPTLVLPTDTGGWLTFEVAGAPLNLTAGTYLVAAVETDSTLSLGITTSVFTPGTVWVDWIGNPNGTWSNVESFGPNFARTFLIRANLQGACTTLPTVTASATNDTICAGDPVTLTYGGNATTYVWSNGVTNGVPFIPVATQTYTVTGTDASGCVNTDSIEVVVKSCVGLEDILGNEILSVYPNPSTGIFQMQVKKDIQVSIYTMDGRMIQNHRLNPGSQLLNLENESSGIYMMQINTADGQYRMKLIKE
ncbi:MAG: choice-of-anchor J domain-containing protein [Bacteroidia bacterium]|jgi:hypothetical protein|nr:choice-of-anchor J domain-containing protein [Bacteroidia bacterium]